MRTFYRLLFALGIMSTALSAQAGVSHVYGSTQTINSNAYVYASDIATDGDGNVYLVGRFKGGSVGGTSYDGTTDFNPGTGSDNRTPLQSNYSGDAYLTKINADGSYAWTEILGYAAGSAFADGVAVDSAGNVYITGSYIGTMDFDPGSGTALHTTSGGYYRFVVKLHNDGSYAWMLDGLAESQNSGIHRTRIKIDGNDDFYLAGTSAAGSFDFDLTADVDTITVTGGTAAYVSKYHSDGTYGWTRVYTSQDPSDYVHITDLAFDSSGNLLVLGDFNGLSANPTVDVDPGSGTKLVSQTMNICQVHNFIVPLLPVSGDYGGWVIPMPRSYNSFVLDSQNNIYLTGISQDGAYDPFACQKQLGDYQVGGNYSAVLTKIIGHTGYGWTKRFVSVPNGAYSRGIGEKIVADSVDSVYVIGGSEYAGVNASSDPLYVARFTPSGEMSWMKSYGIGNSYRAVIDKDNNIYTTGEFGLSADFDPGAETDAKTPTGSVSVYLTKFTYNTANTAPQAAPHTFYIDQDTTLYGTLSAGDAENDPLSYSIVAKGNLGSPTITDAATGAFTYHPIPGDSGTDSFTYMANDGQLNSNIATITVKIAHASPGADLIITKLSAPTGAEPGKYITASTTVTNDGGSPAGPFKVALYLSTDDIITSDDIYLGYRSVTSLANNGTNTASSIVRIPPSLARGKYYLGAIADYQSTIEETDETNNTTAMDFEVEASDLVISAFSGPSSAAQATSVTVLGKVWNQGKAASPISYVGLYLSTDSDITPDDTSLGYVLIGALAVNGSASFSKSVKIPAGLAVGTYYLGAIADYTDKVTESDETNNSSSATEMDIVIPIPDLTVTSVSGSPDVVASQGELTLNGIVLNSGTGTPGTTSYAGFYLSDGVSDIFLKRVRISATLAPDTSVALSTVTQLPANVTEGNYTVKLVADYTGTLAESDETNNTRIGNSITVTAPAVGTSTGSQTNLPQNGTTATSSQSNQTSTVPSNTAGSSPTSNDGSSSASNSPASTGGGGATEITTLMLLGVLVMARRSGRKQE